LALIQTNFEARWSLVKTLAKTMRGSRRWSSYRAYALGETGAVKVNEWSVLQLKVRAPAMAAKDRAVQAVEKGHLSKSARSGPPRQAGSPQQARIL
jgi:hypothetical protein